MKDSAQRNAQEPSGHPTVLEVRNFSVDIAGRRVVDAVDFSLLKGETLALLGESGCGKTMTALGLMRLLPRGATISGSVRLAGRELTTLPENAMREVRGAGLAMVFQEPGVCLNPVMNVRHHLAEALAPRALLPADEEKECVRLLQVVGVSDALLRLTAFPFELSGGLKQRVMIAMALAANPLVLLADEPTTALDMTVQAQVLSLLRTIQSKAGMLLITHDLGVVAAMAHRVGVMYGGSLVEDAPCEKILSAPAHPYTRLLLAVVPDATDWHNPLKVMSGQAARHIGVGCRFALRCPWVAEKCRQQEPPWSVWKEGHRVKCWRVEEIITAPLVLNTLTEQKNTEDAVCLSVRHLQFSYTLRRNWFIRKSQQLRAVDDVSFSIAAGETLALVGESGCGKSTLGRVLLKLTGPAQGSVLLEGDDVLTASRATMHLLRRKMQMVFQDPHNSLNPRHRVGDVIAEGLRALAVVPASDIEQRVIDTLESVGLSAESASHFPHEFSGGQRQRIAVARALAVHPRFVVLDEPTGSLDVSIQGQVLALLRTLQLKHQLAYLFITHNLSVAGFFAQRIAVMYLGRIVEAGDAQTILNRPAHPYTQALLDALPRLKGWAPHPLRGEVPSAVSEQTGCAFSSRCPKVMDECRHNVPPESTLSPGQVVRCFLYR